MGTYTPKPYTVFHKDGTRELITPGPVEYNAEISPLGRRAKKNKSGKQKPKS